MGQQLSFLDRDATLHHVFFAFLPDAAMAACAVGIACDVRRRLGLTATPIPPERLHVSCYLSVIFLAGVRQLSSIMQ